jgi:hypothetical protein
MIKDIIKTWCTKCQKTNECFIFDENNNYTNQDCKRCKQQCPPFATAEIKVICPSCTRIILRENGLEPVGPTQAGSCRWFSIDCRDCSKMVSEPCKILKKHTKLK